MDLFIQLLITVIILLFLSSIFAFYYYHVTDETKIYTVNSFINYTIMSVIILLIIWLLVPYLENSYIKIVNSLPGFIRSKIID